MIKVTKLNGEKFVINCSQIISIESIPESKVILHNGTFYIVKETPDEIINMVIEYYSKIESLHDHTLVVKKVNKF
ncbi:MAG: flagellar FlbD family protein [Clostridia bacterium]|jgi:flagellar protein FlbD|nr:flagellar FlbD family protein [Clostridia bacterium]MCI1999862.1 flagellar FlbD family protein [Clostridia bacterium]MCI2014222.1 flagellar FlbD family protein [Clostridia bacterium]